MTAWICNGVKGKEIILALYRITTQPYRFLGDGTALQEVFHAQEGGFLQFGIVFLQALEQDGEYLLPAPVRYVVAGGQCVQGALAQRYQVCDRLVALQLVQCSILGIGQCQYFVIKYFVRQHVEI